MNEALAIVALGLLGYAAISRRTAGSALTAPMFFTALGYLVHLLLGGHVELLMEADSVHLLAEITLVVVLFTDASQIDLRELRRDPVLPVRLLAIGLPLTIALGTLGAVLLFPSMGWWEAGLIAAILAPTDAALGQAVVSNPSVPDRVRRALNVESGLNDGIALPVVLLCLYAVEMQHLHEAGTGYWVRFVAMQLGLGPVIGAAVGWLGGRLVSRASASGWMSRTFEQLSAIGIAVLAFAAAEIAGGNGFLAAFVAGITLGNTARAVRRCLVDFGETEGQLLTLVTFTTFGALMVPFAVDHFDVAVAGYALASLTVIRAVPVALSLLGVSLTIRTVGFLAWFGPRGIASLLYALVVVERATMGVVEEVLAVVTTTVLLSVLLHGVTAAPLARRYRSDAGID